MAICIQYKNGTPTKPIDSGQAKRVMMDEAHCQSVRLIHSLAARSEALKDSNPEESKKAKSEAAMHKGKLPGFIFQCSKFEPHEWIDTKKKNHGIGEWRHQENGVLNGLFMVDYDHIENPRKVYEQIDPGILKAWGLKMAFVSPSGYGLKMVLEARLEVGNLASNQLKFSQEIGLTCDEKCKDSSRLSFAPMWEDVLYYSEDLFTYENEEYSKKYTPVYVKGITQPDLFGSDKNPAAEVQTAVAVSTGEKEVNEEFENYRYHGFSLRDIINAYYQGTPPGQGDRHDSLLQLATDLRHVCENRANLVKYFINQLPWVDDLRAEGDPVDQTIADALAYKYNRFMPKKMEAALKALEGTKTTDEVGEPKEPTIYDRFEEWGKEIEKLWPEFPCLKEICYGMPTSGYPSVLFAAAAMFGTLATRTWYYFYHNPEQMRRLNYGIFVIADPSSGKSFAGWLYKIIMSPIIADDKLGNNLINKYKKEINERATSQKDQKRGEPIKYPDVKIRIHGCKTANGVFIEDMVKNVEEVDGEPLHLHLFTFDSELDSNMKNSSGGQWIDKSIFELKAFHNEEDNQQYRNKDSVNGPFDVFWNYVYTGTPIALNKKVNARNFGSGLFGRLAVLPLCTPKYKMMPFQKKSKTNIQVIDTLKEWAFKLHQTYGELPFWPLVKTTWDWCNDMMSICEQEDDNALSLLIRRVPYYGINVSAPFIIMRHWKDWTEKRDFTIDETDKKLCNLVMEIQLYCQKFYFGKLAENYYEEIHQDIAEKTNVREGKNTKLLKVMPMKFDYAKLMEIGEMTHDYARVVVHRWIQDRLVKKIKSGKNAIFERI